MKKIDTTTWHIERSTKDCWMDQSDIPTPNRKMLISWMVWIKGNAHVFRPKKPTILNTIDREARAKIFARPVGAFSSPWAAW